jgi:hypothetical protein
MNVPEDGWYWVRLKTGWPQEPRLISNQKVWFDDTNKWQFIDTVWEIGPRIFPPGEYACQSCSEGPAFDGSPCNECSYKKRDNWYKPVEKAMQ